MDSTRQPHLSVKASASKLPVKRKTPDFSSSFSPISNPPYSSPVLTPKLQHADADYGGDDDDDNVAFTGDDRRPPPFKFHRVWSEPDEIRFLRGLLDCSSSGLSFPRDLHLFYSRISHTMSQSYSKSQLSEKLRRLRKKFRVVSSRLTKGIDKALLPPHDRAVYELSKKLWHQEFSKTSPFGLGSGKKSNLVGARVSFSPTLPSDSAPELGLVSDQTTNQELNENNFVDHCVGYGRNKDGFCADNVTVNLSSANVEFVDCAAEQELIVARGSEGSIGQAVAKALNNVFDQSLKEVRVGLCRPWLLFSDCGLALPGSLKEGKVESFEKRWQEQRVAELDVLGRRLRLVLEHSLRQ